MKFTKFLEYISPCLYLNRSVFNSRYLMSVFVNHCEISEEVSPLSVNWIFEARMISVEISSIHENLLTPVQITDILREGNHVTKIDGRRPPCRLQVSGSEIYASEGVDKMLDLIPLAAGLAVNLQVDLVLVLGPLHQPRLDVDQVHVLVLEHLQSSRQSRHLGVEGEDNRSFECSLQISKVIDSSLLQ